MPNGWGGADPVGQADANDYALGTEQRANVDIRITHIRIYSPPGETTMANRTGKVYTTAGSVLATVALPNDLADGWSTHELATPIPRTANQRWVVAYDTGGNYGALIDAFQLADVNSSDGAVTSLSDANATNGNGIFNTTPGAFPTSSPGRHFYGADVVYELGLVGNTAPRITSTSAIANQLQVTAAATVEDDESLTGLTLRIEWGDGNADTVAYPALSASHTYAAPGTYALLFKATDADGATDFAADYVITTSPDPTFFTLDIPGLLTAVCDAAQKTGHISTVDPHEPREAPNSDLHAGFWWLSTRPAGGRVSGIAGAATVVTLMGRLYVPAGDGTNLPYDDVDLKLMVAIDRLFAAWIGDFTLGGRVRNVDVFGEVSPGLGADGGYVAFGGGNGKKFRVATITLPLIVNDQYEEVP